MSRLPLFVILLWFLPALAWGQNFTLEKLTGIKPGPTLLIIGGIHGDEPGGFNTAALLLTRYRIDNGSLWIIPDLNRISIERRVHGWFGDMNYKFNGLQTSDLDYRIVQQVKQLIKDPQVDLIFNLHDGSGYYRPTRQNSQLGPLRWGQSCVVDQAELPGVRYGNLEQQCQQVAERVNRQLLQPIHRFHVKNTRTASSDPVMQKSLTYYALRQQKPAIGLEASKQLPTHLRVYYLLSAMEAHLQQLGVGFKRDFELTPEAIHQALTKEIRLQLADGRISLPLTNLRPVLKFFPLEKGHPLVYQAKNPLVKVVQRKGRYRIHFGNNRLAYLQPDYVAYDRSLNGVMLEVDGRPRTVDFGTHLTVKDSFRVTPPVGYRANVIGYQHPQKSDDAGQKIAFDQLDPNYSVDNDGRIFRVEVYQQEKFCGMVLVDWDSSKSPSFKQDN